MKRPAKMEQPITTFTDGDVTVYWHFNDPTHCIVYGTQLVMTDNAVTAAHRYGECVRHSLECAGKIGDTP